MSVLETLLASQGGQGGAFRVIVSKVLHANSTALCLTDRAELLQE